MKSACNTRLDSPMLNAYFGVAATTMPLLTQSANAQPEFGTAVRVYRLPDSYVEALELGEIAPLPPMRRTKLPVAFVVPTTLLVLVRTALRVFKTKCPICEEGAPS